MDFTTESNGPAGSRSNEQERLSSSVLFDWMMIAFCSWSMVGFYLDGRAHSHGAVDATLLTPWHGILYSGFFAIVLLLSITLFRNHARGYTWFCSIPIGYELSLLGVIIFAISAAGDLIWHRLFGIERNFDALLSPTHLAIACGGVLIVSAPFRASWHRSDAQTPQSFIAWLPTLLSLTFILSIFTFFTEFAHPFVYPWATCYSNSIISFFGPGVGIISILLQTGLLMGIVLLAVRRWQLPFGSMTLIFTANITLMCLFGDLFQLIPSAIIAGIVADVLLVRLKPSSMRPYALRLFAFSVPVSLYALYFLFLQLLWGICWSVHLWMGSIVLAGIAGLLLSCLVLPPSSPVEEQG